MLVNSTFNNVCMINICLVENLKEAASSAHSFVQKFLFRTSQYQKAGPLLKTSQKVFCYKTE